ncbi:MAG: glycosyltransferase [Candidatus Paracaedibacteraceae bacterium]|nr:glycosyltransferase [Candidatus Paracaedibacteraceae bacterium]
MVAKPFKIVLFCRSLNRGGAERQIIYLAQGLQAAGHHVSILTLYPPSPSWYDTNGLTVIDLKKKSRWDIIGFIRSYIKFLKREQPDIIYSFLTVQNIIATIISLFIKAKVVCGVRTSFMDLSQYKRMDFFLTWLERQLFRFNVKIIANSYAGKDLLIKKAPYVANKIAVATNGLDFESNTFSPLARQQFRTKFGLSDEDILIGHVGRYDPMKDHKTFIDAAALLLEKSFKGHFICWGHGDSVYTEQLKNYAKSKDVPIIWYFEEGNPCYSAFDVYCLTSIGEGYSNTLVEAMAQGIPCITTDVGDCRKIVGKHGFTIEPSNPSELAAAIMNIIDKKISIPVQEQIAYSHQQFSLQKLIDNTLLEFN